MKTSYTLTKLQKQIVDLVSDIKNPYNLAEYSDFSGRCITYWRSGQRAPRDLVTIENVLDALGYELVIRRKK